MNSLLLLSSPLFPFALFIIISFISHDASSRHRRHGKDVREPLIMFTGRSNCHRKAFVALPRARATANCHGCFGSKLILIYSRDLLPQQAFTHFAKHLQTNMLIFILLRYGRANVSSFPAESTRAPSLIRSLVVQANNFSLKRIFLLFSFSFPRSLTKSRTKTRITLPPCIPLRLFALCDNAISIRAMQSIRCCV